MLVTRHRVGECMPAVVHAGPDPAALAVCRELMETTSAAAVILHGSRARGNWDEQSDLDLIMVLEGSDEEERTKVFGALESIKDRNYPGWRDTPALRTSLEEGQETVCPEYYDARMRTLNHYIARAARDGRIFTKDPKDEQLYRHAGDISNEWELVTRERLKMAGEEAGSVQFLQDRWCSQESVKSRSIFPRMVGRSAHGMLWHSGAALLSVLKVAYPTRSVEEIGRSTSEHDRSWAHEFRTDLAQIDQYAECGCELVVTDPIQVSPELWESLEQDRAALWQRILELSGYDLNGELPPARGGA